VIQFVAQILTEIIPQDNFIGHIGGDDFVAMLNSYEVDDVCADFGECDGDRRTEATAGTGDYCNLTVKAEIVEDHVSLFPCRRTP